MKYLLFDFGRIRKHNGFVYYWVLSDLLKPNKGGLSNKMYYQDDCKLFSFKVLSSSFQKASMDFETGKTYTPKNPKWNYSPPDTILEYILKSFCSR